MNYKSLHRFVSLIPLTNISIEDNFFQCLSIEEILFNMKATNFEHSILLCSYLKYINEDAYIVLGIDKIIGPTSFILLKKETFSILIDPIYYRTWKLEDKSNTLIKIHTIFNEKNIWFNIQNFEEPWNINYNFERSNQWLSFFSKDFKNINNNHLDEINIEYIYENNSNELLNELNTQINIEFEKFRNDRPTNWNDSISNLLNNLLKEFENSNEINLNEIYNLIGNNFLIGSPFCISGEIKNSNLVSIIEQLNKEILHQNLYNSDLSKIIFSKGIYIESYPNSLYLIRIIIIKIYQL